MHSAILRDGVTLASPKLGVFASRLVVGDVVRPGVVLGTLRILNRTLPLIAPAGAHGVIERGPSARHAPVEYGEALFTLGALDARVAVEAQASASEVASGVSVTAPITGIFYRRAAPSSPAYVEVGQSVVTGQTVGLIEVMKTFNPVVYSGAPGVVVATPAEDRQEVAAGQALVVVRPST